MPEKSPTPTILSVEKIWDQAEHNAFTSLLYHEGQWWCVFREGSEHVVGAFGAIRVIRSPDGKTWVSQAIVTEPDVDLRDPKLSIMPNGQVLLLYCACRWTEEGEYVSRQSRVCFSEDLSQWTDGYSVLLEHEWLWQLVWNDGIGYGTAYSPITPTDPGQGSRAQLYATVNGLDYSLVTPLAVPGNPNEVAHYFPGATEMMALVRRNDKDNPGAWIGRSVHPFLDWQWTPTTHHMGGPCIVADGEGDLWAGGRLILNPGEEELNLVTALTRLTSSSIEPVLQLPSSGDTSYPGMVYQEGVLWMSYYSSHEGKSAIYLARIALP